MAMALGMAVLAMAMGMATRRKARPPSFLGPGTVAGGSQESDQKSLWVSWIQELKGERGC
jgi:hypothetical protein